MKEKYLREIYSHMKNIGAFIDPNQPYNDEFKDYIVNSIARNCGRNGMPIMLSEQCYGWKYCAVALGDSDVFVSPYWIPIIKKEAELHGRKVKFSFNMLIYDFKRFVKRHITMPYLNRFATLSLLTGILLRLFGFISFQWLIVFCLPALILFLVGFIGGVGKK